MKTLILLALLGMTAPAWAQSAEQLKRENEALRAQLAQREEQPISVSVESVRKQEKSSGPSHLIVTLKIRNQTQKPMALNILGRSRAMQLVDSNGNRFSPTQSYGKVHGIPVATDTLADATPNLQPGGTLTVVIDATSYLKNGARMGDAFDLNMTLGQFSHNARGQIEKVAEFPVSFVGQAIQSGAANQAVDNAVGGAVDRLLKKL